MLHLIKSLAAFEFMSCYCTAAALDDYHARQNDFSAPQKHTGDA
jgi:hypothetical protein